MNNIWTNMFHWPSNFNIYPQKKKKHCGHKRLDENDLDVEVVWKVTAQCIAIKELQSNRYRRAMHEASEFA